MWPSERVKMKRARMRRLTRPGQALLAHCPTMTRRRTEPAALRRLQRHLRDLTRCQAATRAGLAVARTYEMSIRARSRLSERETRFSAARGGTPRVAAISGYVASSTNRMRSVERGSSGRPDVDVSASPHALRHGVRVT